MWLGAVAFAVPGLALTLNVRHIDDWLARMNRALPWWLKSPGGDNPATHRAVGVGLLLFAAALAYAAIGFR